MIHRWDIITIGNLSRNRYWGESEETPHRKALCTCTLVQGDGLKLLVDPSVADAQGMAAELDRGTGLTLEAVHQVFITHAHGDHHAGLRHFPSARWMAAPGVAEAINRSGEYTKPVESVTGSIVQQVEVLPTPGHTLDHHSLRFVCDGQTVIIAGDAVMTRDFWLARRGFFNSVDLAMAGETIQKLATLADAIVPGHDNWFMNKRQG